MKFLSIGAAVQDVFLSGRALTPVETNGEWFEELPIGGKLDVDQIAFSTGGGATNASVTFARGGHQATFLGQIGQDPAGAAVIVDLKKDGVETEHIIRVDDNSTGYSVLLLAPDGGRTILTYRGASTHYQVDKFDLSAIDFDWLYISSVAGDMGLLRSVVDQAHKKGAKIAINPGKGELAQPDEMRRVLAMTNILSVNKEEMQKLLSTDENNEDELLRMASHLGPSVTLVTDGPKGAWARSKNGAIVWAGMYEDVPVKDRTGAGDAFSSGFTLKIAEGSSLEEALVYASANSTSVVSYIGAKTGILQASEFVPHDMPLDRR